MFTTMHTAGGPRDRRSELAAAVARQAAKRSAGIADGINSNAVRVPHTFDPNTAVREAILRRVAGASMQPQPVNLSPDQMQQPAPPGMGYPAGQSDDPETRRLRAEIIARQAQTRTSAPPQTTATGPHYGHAGSLGERMDRMRGDMGGGQGPSQDALIAERDRRQALAALRPDSVAARRAEDAELDRLLTELRNAHDAGDTEGARRIARTAQERLGTPQAGPSGSTPYHPRAADLAATGWANGAQLNMRKAPEPSRVRAAVRGAADAITFGHLDEMNAAAGSLLPGRTYEGEIDRVREMDAIDREAHPVAAIGGQVAGSIAGPGLAARGVGAAVSGGRQLARVAGLGAAQGGAYAFGSAEGDLSERAGAVPAGMGLGAAGGAVGAGIGSGFTRAAQVLSRSPAGQAVAPTVEGLRTSAQRLYEQVEKSGATIPANHVGQLARSVRNKLTGDGYNARLHPRVSAVLDEIEGRSGPMTLREADVLRRVATNAAQGTSPDEARLAVRAADAIDGVIDRLGDQSAPLREARAMWHTMRKSEAVEEAIERATTGPSSFAQNLQTEFRRLIRNKRAMRGFSDAERRAIAKVVSGGAVEGTLRFLGKSMSPTGMMGAITSGGVALTGNIPAAAAMAATGGTSRLVADAMTRRSSQNALATVAGGDARQAILEAILRAQQSNALAGVAPGAALGGGYAGQMHPQGRGG